MGVINQSVLKIVVLFCSCCASSVLGSTSMGSCWGNVLLFVFVVVVLIIFLAMVIAEVAMVMLLVVLGVIVVVMGMIVAVVDGRIVSVWLS